MNASELFRLRVVLLALIPTYRQAVSVQVLAVAAVTAPRAVHEALAEPLQRGEVRYELMDDCYAVVKQGDAP